MSPPSFFDKLAPELRVAIYGHLLCSSKIIKPSASTASLGIDKEILAISAHEELEHTTVETCILATNKLIYKEATQVLYHNKMVRATFVELERLLRHSNFVANVEFIEIADCVDARRRGGLRVCASVLKRLQQLPRVRPIVVLSDRLNGLTLHDLGHWAPYTSARFITVSAFIESVLGLGRTTCVDIGRYQLYGEYSEVQVVNRKLAAMWPSAQSVPADYNAWADLESLTQKWKVLADIPDQIALTLQTSFRCWVGLHEELASMEASGKLRDLFEQDTNHSISDFDKAKLSVAKRWVAATLHSRLTGVLHPLGIQEPTTLNLRHLKPGDDPNTLRWATEYLASNVAVLRCDPRTNPSFNDTVVQYWAEADGGTHTIERRIEEQKLAFAGLPNPSYVLDPVRKTSVLDHSIVKRHIEATHLDYLTTHGPAEALDPLEFVQLAHLCIALMESHASLSLPDDATYRQEHAQWASTYLRSHLLVSEWVDPDVVRDMSLADMRNSLAMLLQRRVHSLNEVRTDPPEGIDPDRFLPLAWKWSWEYASICIEQHEASQEEETSSNWEKAGSEAGSDSEGEG